MRELLLALNVGSSSVKLGLYERCGSAPGVLAKGSVRTGDGRAGRLRIESATGDVLLDQQLTDPAAVETVERILEWIEGNHEDLRLSAVGHRIVHGGTDFRAPVEIDPSVFRRLEALTPLAPLHQPPALEPVYAISRLRPGLPQIACFDTAFHSTIKPPASRYALPRILEMEGIRRYGFHGLSYQSIAAQLAEEMDEEDAQQSRVIVAHLGNGASLCAMRGLKSVDTTMGFSTLDGVVMGARPGSLDPGILLYLMAEKGYSPERLENLLYRQSGLLGVSGISSDVATLLRSNEPAAVEALELFAFSIARHTASLAATLGGLDRFIFTGGIGEHSSAVRRMVIERLGWLGAEIDDSLNGVLTPRISSSASRILVEQRRTDEELIIATHTMAALTAV